MIIFVLIQVILNSVLILNSSSSAPQSHFGKGKGGFVSSSLSRSRQDVLENIWSNGGKKQLLQKVEWQHHSTPELCKLHGANATNKIF